MTDAAAADPRAAIMSVVGPKIEKGMRGLTKDHKHHLRLACTEYLRLMPDEDVPVVTADTWRDFVRRLPCRPHCRA